MTALESMTSMQMPRKDNEKLDWEEIRTNVSIVALILVCLGLVVDGIVYQFWYLPSVEKTASIIVGLSEVLTYFTTVPGMLAQLPVLLGLAIYILIQCFENL